MTNHSLIEKAAKMVIDTQERAYHTSMSWSDAYMGATNWYNNTDITSPYMIAACVLKFGVGYRPVSFNEIMEASKQFEKEI